MPSTTITQLYGDRRWQGQGRGERDVQRHRPDDSSPQGGKHTVLQVGRLLAARPLALDEPRPRVRVLRRTVEQFGDVVPLVPALAVSAPQMVDQLVAVLARQVIEVPKVSCLPRCGRTVLCTPQTAEQLVTVPTILYFLKQTVGTRGRSGGPQGFLPEQRRPSTVEQIVDIPAPGRGVQRGLQGFSQERSSTAFDGAEHRFPAATAEQNVDIPVPGGLSVSGSSSSSAVLRDVRGDGVFRTFPQQKKCDSTSALGVGTASALEPMDAGCL